MDNITLLETLIILVGLYAIFTYAISSNINSDVAKRWRISSIFIFLGTILLLSQGHLSYWISIILSNYLILLGMWFHISCVLHFEIKTSPNEKIIISVITLIYGVCSYYYTFFDFNEAYRIVIFSSVLAVLYFLEIIYVVKKSGSLLKLISRDLWFLFCFSCLFYLVRLVVTIIEYKTNHGGYFLLEKGALTSVTILFAIIYNTIFIHGMFNATLKEKNKLLKQDKNRFTHLFEFLNDTAKHLDLQGLYRSIETVLRKSFGVPTGAIYLIDEGNGEYSHTMAYIFNELEVPINKVKYFKKGEGLSGQAIEQKKVIVVDIDNYPSKEISIEFKNKGVTHMVSIPLKVANKIIGAITIVYSIEKMEKELFDEAFLLYLGEQISLVLNNAILYEKLSGLANTDFLTGLYNRRKLQELFYLEEKRNKRKSESLTVALIDLDYFKKVNDTFGHECGDKVIKCMARVLKDSCRDTDYICRWGGEEFLVLFVETSLSNAQIAAERIRSVFASQLIECMNGTSVTASIGLAEMSRVDETLDELTIRADNALYEAKNNGRNQVCCSYTDE